MIPFSKVLLRKKQKEKLGNFYERSAINMVRKQKENLGNFDKRLAINTVNISSLPQRHQELEHTQRRKRQE